MRHEDQEVSLVLTNFHQMQNAEENLGQEGQLRFVLLAQVITLYSNYMSVSDLNLTRQL